MTDDVKCCFIVSHLTLGGWLGSPMGTRPGCLRRSRSQPDLRSTSGDVTTEHGQMGAMLPPPPGSGGHAVTLRIYLEGWSLKKQCLGWDLKSKGKEGSSQCRRNYRGPGQWWEDIGEGGIWKTIVRHRGGMTLERKAEERNGRVELAKARP